MVVAVCLHPGPPGCAKLLNSKSICQNPTRTDTASKNPSCDSLSFAFAFEAGEAVFDSRNNRLPNKLQSLEYTSASYVSACLAGTRSHTIRILERIATELGCTLRGAFDAICNSVTAEVLCLGFVLRISDDPLVDKLH